MVAWPAGCKGSSTESPFVQFTALGMSVKVLAIVPPDCTEVT
jgi:hypothetical protein